MPNCPSYRPRVAARGRLQPVSSHPQWHDLYDATEDWIPRSTPASTRAFIPSCTSCARWRIPCARALHTRRAMDVVAFGETFHQVVLVLPHSLGEVRGHADIQRAVPLACQNVHSRLFAHWRIPGYRLSPVRRLGLGWPS